MPSTNLHFIDRGKCPICGSGAAEEIFRCKTDDEPISSFMKHRYPNYLGNNNPVFDYTIMKCDWCSGYFQKTILHNFCSDQWDWKDTPERSWERQAQKLSHKSYILKFVCELNLVKHLLGGQSYGRRVLDFGCGYGYWCQVAKAFGFTVFGAETNEASRSHALSMKLDLIDLNEGTTEKFDFVNTEQVFEHLEEPLVVLEMLAKYLNPGGFIRISVPNAQYIEVGIKNGKNWVLPEKERMKRKNKKRDLNPIVPLTHINGFTQQSLRKMAEKVGLIPYKIPFAEYIRTQRACAPFGRVVRAALRHSLSRGAIILLRKPMGGLKG